MPIRHAFSFNKYNDQMIIDVIIPAVGISVVIANMGRGEENNWYVG